MVKTTEVLAIAGGVAVIGGVLAYSVLKSKGLTPLQTSQTPPSPPTGCTSNSQCPSGYICVNGQCVQSKGCSSNSECPSGYVCQDGACVPAVQCGTQGAPCNSTTQCCSGYTCIRRYMHELPYWFLFLFRVLGPCVLFVPTPCSSCYKHNEVPAC